MRPRNIIGYLSDKEGRTLKRFASKVSEGAIVDIGTFQGKSAIYMALSGKKVYTIDKYEYELFKEYIRRFRVENRIIQIVESSHTVNWDKPIGLIFIDELHFYEDVEGDYLKFEPFVVSGGIMVFHDYDSNLVSRIGVKKFLNDYQKEIDSKFVVEKKMDYMLCLRKR